MTTRERSRRGRPGTVAWAGSALAAGLVLATWMTAAWITSITETRTLTVTSASPSTSPPPDPSASPSPSPSPTPSASPSPSPSPSPGTTSVSVAFTRTVSGLRAAALPDLDAVAIHLKSDPTAIAVVVGLPDPAGGPTVPGIAFARANTVADYLIRRGIPEHRVAHTIAVEDQPGDGDSVVGARVIVAREG